MKCTFLMVAIGVPASVINYAFSDVDRFMEAYPSLSAQDATALRFDDSVKRGFEFGLGIGLGAVILGAAAGAKKEDEPEIQTEPAAPKPGGPA